MEFLAQKYKNVISLLDEHKALKEDIKALMVEALEEFAAIFNASTKK